jgi:hypothetical protein
LQVTIGGITLKICIEPIPPPSSFAPVPTGFDQWFAKMVHRDPAQRFSSAREAAEALRKLCMSESGAERLAAPLAESSGAFQATATTAPPLSRSASEASAAPSPQRKRIARWVVAAAVLFVAAVALWLRSAGKPGVGAEVAPSARASAVAATAPPPLPTPAALLSAPIPEPPPASVPTTLANPTPSASSPVTAPPARPAKNPGSRPNDRGAPATAKAATATSAPAAPPAVGAAPARPTDPGKAAPAARDLLDSR